MVLIEILKYYNNYIFSYFIKICLKYIFIRNDKIIVCKVYIYFNVIFKNKNNEVCFY